MRLLILTRYDSLGASSRLRFYQFVPYLKSKGFDITIQHLLSNEYINHLYNKTPLPIMEIIKSYFRRALILINKNKFDLIWLQHEAFPWIPNWIEKLFFKTKIPVIVDYDDAFFHRYDLNNSTLIKFVLKNKINNVMNQADTVIVGNEYLSDRAKISNAKSIYIIPTVVDTDRYEVVKKNNNGIFTIGWIGSPNNSKYLMSIKNAFKEIGKDPKIKLVLIGSQDIELENIDFKVKPWNENSEVEEIKKFDVGIMPLIDNPWERGKCGFKLIQYMACGIPVIASPIGINSKIVENGTNGYLAETEDDWIKYIKILKNDFNLRIKMGINGRRLVLENYSLQLVSGQIETILKNNFANIV